MHGRFYNKEEIFQLAKKHSFYGERLRGVQSFVQAPTINKIDLYAAIAAAQTEPGFHKGIYWSPTGGSTSQLLFYPTAIDENQFQRQKLLPYLSHTAMFTVEMVALNLFGSTMMYRSAEIFNYFCEQAGATTLPVSSQCPDLTALEIALRFGANTLMGNTSRLLQFARYVESVKQQFGEIEIKFEHVVFGGEGMPVHKMEYLRQVLGSDKFSGIFGSAESGIWAFKPSALPLNTYFYARQLMHLEIVEPDADGFGRMVLTNLVRGRNPLLRYDCGDRARFCQAPDICSFSENDNLGAFELTGRVEGSFQLGGEYYYLSEFTKLLAESKDLLLDYQIELSYDPIKKLDQARFLVVSQPSGKGEGKRQADRLLIKNAVETWINPDDNLFLLAVEFVEMDRLTRSSTAQKVVRISDLRS